MKQRNDAFFNNRNKILALSLDLFISIVLNCFPDYFIK